MLCRGLEIIYYIIKNELLSLMFLITFMSKGWIKCTDPFPEAAQCTYDLLYYISHCSI